MPRKVTDKTHPPAERLVAYSDALFAFAATLLILGLKIPTPAELGGGSLAGFLLAQWPSYLSFFISFIIITVVWSNHHVMFRYIRRTDHTLMLLNSLLMFNIVAIPFGAGLLGQYLMGAPDNARVAALVYGGWIALGGIPFNLVWRYGSGDPALVDPRADRAEIDEISRHFIRGPFFYLAATLLALWNVWASLAGFLALILLFLAPATIGLRARRHR